MINLKTASTGPANNIHFTLKVRNTPTKDDIYVISYKKLGTGRFAFIMKSNVIVVVVGLCKWLRASI